MREISRRAASAARERTSAALRDAVRSAVAGGSWLWARRPPAPRAAAILFVAATAAVSAWAILAQARLPARLPSAVDWAAARALVERDARPGDAAALAPPWAERAREILPASVPVLAQRRYAGEDLVGVRRLWLLSLPEAPRFSWEVEVDIVERAARSEAPARLGALEVTRYDLAFPTLPLAFLPDRLARAEVWLGALPCSRETADRYVCGDRSAEIARTVREVDGVARPCLSALAPATLDEPLVVTFPPTRIGRTLLGHVGRVGGEGAPLRISLQLEGDEIGAAEIDVAAWTPFRVDLARAAGQTRPLSLVLTSPAPLDVCLDAAVMP
jgi:hypothetical protein